MTSLTSAGATYWMLGDNLDSIRDVVDSTGKLRIHRDFDSFGNVLGETHYNASGGVVTSSQSGYVDEAFGYTGRMLDDETGLQNNLNRWYDSATGRWISKTRLALGQATRISHRYVSNEPTGSIDPYGLQPQQQYGDAMDMGGSTFCLALALRTCENESDDRKLHHLISRLLRRSCGV